tara:strand:- start:39 stop:239 length:201 start_codon:yes stop_codon:yes gene_type:complete
MDHQEAKDLAEKLKGFACIECTKDWLEKREDLTDPIQDIREVCSLALITSKLQDKLINEIESLRKA